MACEIGSSWPGAGTREATVLGKLPHPGWALQTAQMIRVQERERMA